MNLVSLIGSPNIGPRELAALFEELEQNSIHWLKEAGNLSTSVGPLFEDLGRAASGAIDRLHRAKARLETEQALRSLAARGQELLAQLEGSTADFS